MLDQGGGVTALVDQWGRCVRQGGRVRRTDRSLHLDMRDHLRLLVKIDGPQRPSQQLLWARDSNRDRQRQRDRERETERETDRDGPQRPSQQLLWARETRIETDRDRETEREIERETDRDGPQRPSQQVHCIMAAFINKSPERRVSLGYGLSYIQLQSTHDRLCSFVRSILLARSFDFVRLGRQCAIAAVFAPYPLIAGYIVSGNR